MSRSTPTAPATRPARKRRLRATMSASKIDLSCLSPRTAVLEAKKLDRLHPDLMADLKFPPVVWTDVVWTEAELRRFPSGQDEIREAITRTVKALEIEPGVGLFACAWRACTFMSVAEAQDLERRFIDDLVLAVGSVLTRAETRRKP